jgi:hypothetical protein
MDTSWTEVGDVNTARRTLEGAGTQYCGFSFLEVFLQTTTGATESWNGTSWTELNDLNTAKKIISRGRELHTAALAFGGNTPTGSKYRVLEWNYLD